MKDIIKIWVQLWARKRSFKQAVKQADELRSKTFKKHHVIFWRGEFVAISRQTLKQYLKDGAFRKGVNMVTLKKIIYYTTN